MTGYPHRISHGGCLTILHRAGQVRVGEVGGGLGAVQTSPATDVHHGRESRSGRRVHSRSARTTATLLLPLPINTYILKIDLKLIGNVFTSTRCTANGPRCLPTAEELRCEPM